MPQARAGGKVNGGFAGVIPRQRRGAARVL